MLINYNVGLLGHVDSGKTTLARALSAISSTACFDKHPQSQERGITLDLGFSGLVVEAPARLREVLPSVEQLQFTFVDCPGHASLIRTIIGGVQIIDLMLLVVDAQKGIQTQTAECLVIGELLRRKLIVVINKIDTFPPAEREDKLRKLHNRLRKILAGTSFGENVSIVNVSALEGTNITELCDCLSDAFNLPERVDSKAPLVMYVDHCFTIKGKGTICTGTVLQGEIATNDTIEFPALAEQRKVKSIQMFKRSVDKAIMGDRIGLCVTQLNSKLLERGIIAKPGHMKFIHAACVRLHPIRYYKTIIKTKSKFHISVGHETVMATLIMFSHPRDTEFGCTKEYEYVEELTPSGELIGCIYALLQFETPVLATAGATLMASKLDMDVHSSSCRLAFWGTVIWLTHNVNYELEELPNWRIFKRKQKQANVQRVINANEVIVQNLFKKEANRDAYVGMQVHLSTGEIGCISRTFGQTSKVCITFSDGLAASTLKILKSDQCRDVQVQLKCKKYIFNKKAGLFQ